MSRTYGKLKQEALLGKLPYGKKVKAIKKDLMKPKKIKKAKKPKDDFVSLKLAPSRKKAQTIGNPFLRGIGTAKKGFGKAKYSSKKI
tara:strand:+ start:90 stop:350 length:261 start_codon:yes stop_codon:yes gene_type:complete